MKNLNKCIDSYNEKHELTGRDKMTHVELSKRLTEKMIKEGRLKTEYEIEKQIVNFKNLFYRVTNGKIDKFPIDLVNEICIIIESTPNQIYNFKQSL